MIWATVSSRSYFCWLYAMLSHFSHVRLLATPWTATYQAPPSMGFSRQEYWSGVPSPSLCWLYRASQSLAAKNINQSDFGVDHLVMSMCGVFSCVAGRQCFMTSEFSWQNSMSLCPASFCPPRPDLPVTPGVSWLPTFAFQSPIMKRISFLCVSSKRSCRSS